LRKLKVERLPLLVINDSVGGELYVQPDLKAVGL
jgi:tartrate dehydratase beta subunit/fumarate hydratase class I family protein